MFITCLGASGQNERLLGRYISQAWGTAQGFAYGRITALAQTPDGYLWIGTDKNLLRFDGFAFEPLLKDHNAASLSVASLTVDHKGSLWVRTEDAQLLRVTGNQLSTVMSPSQGYQSIIAVAAAASSGVLVSGVAEGILSVTDHHPQVLHLQAPQLAISLTQTEAGQIWAGSRGGGLFRAHDHALEQVTSVGADTKINCLISTGTDKVWLGTDQGLLLLDARNLSRVEHMPLSGAPQVLAMVEDHDGQLWAGSSEGLVRVSGGKPRWVLRTGRAVTAVLADREGNIWFGDGEKLIRLRDTPVITYKPPPAAEGAVGAVATDKRGRIWFAPLSGGLFWMTEGQFHRISAANLDHDVVYSIDCIDDDIWIGRKTGGLTRLHAVRDGFEEHSWSSKDGLPADSIYAVRAQADGSVWAASLTSGVAHLIKGRFTRFGLKELGSESVSAIEPMKDGSVWFATPKGLMHLKSGAWERYAGNGILPSGEVLSLCVDDRDGLFVGTSLGLAYINANERGARLPAFAKNEPVFGVALDRHGNVWISTTSHVLRLSDAEHLRANGSASVREYTTADGLENSSGIRRTRSMVSNATGDIYVSTEGGLAVAHSSMTDTQVPAFAHIESVAADGSLLPLSQRAYIPSGTRRITFNFAGLDLRAPEQVRLRFRLDGFDQTWSESAATRQASYTNLSPGSYQFRLLARNSQGEWSGQESLLPIVVEPLLYQRWSFRIALTTLLLALIVWAFHARIRFITAQMNVLADERHAERTRIARELHDTLLQGVMSVMLRLHVVTEGVVPTNPTRQALDKLLDVMEGVIEDARLAVQGLRNTDRQITDLECFFHHAQIEVARDSTAECHLEVKGQKREVRALLCDELSRIGGEAIQNASRHSQATRISVTLNYGKAALSLQISDDGVGMETALISKGKTGHWGLVGMRERARSIGGRFAIVSSPGKGTNVSIEVPAKIAYARERRTATSTSGSGQRDDSLST